MAVLSVQDVSQAGLAASFSSANGGGDSFIDNGRQQTFLEVVNGSGGSINVTIAAVADTVSVPGIGPVAVDDLVVAVAAGARKHIGPFPKAYRSSTGSVSVAYSSPTSVTVAAIRVGPVD